ncbi:MAG: Asp-tRNA(Asn)/Glu-tRNA(Gln) amidotransferase subunit GatB [Candidatus Roizmanbacteria bacterium]|nr:Asp-tRNA(Asn)/Glu-tRNA(Gln) amidotransferase subunit GatB [Candidatus Roizmanbacteria bacterium]
MTYELVLGLEIHLQMNTVMKMFCSCKNEPFGSNPPNRRAKPNTHVCPVCLGLPGAMPVPNKEAIEKAQSMAHALGSNLRDEIIFERKNYFYPDLPKAFQLTTPHYPVAEGGIFKWTHVNEKKEISWREIHIEEDTAKSMHKDGKTWIDFNKSGVPLLEMVSEPDFKTIEDAVLFAKEVQKIAREIKASEADMEKGHMRLEANISLRKKGQKDLPAYRVEIKNINSFTFMKNALNVEVERQTQALEKGETLTQETRGYNEDKKITFSQRSKEEAHDYRYFPEPDIPPIRFSKQQLDLVKNSVPELPESKKEKLIKYNVKVADAGIIASNPRASDLAFGTIQLAPNAGATIGSMIVNKKIAITSTPEEFYKLLKEKENVITDDSQLKTWVEKAIQDNQKAAEDVRSGKMQAMGALIGAVMKYSKGKGDAKKISELLRKKLTT